MKPIKKRWLSLAAAPFALAILAFAQPALANDFNGTCAQYPGTFDGTGNVTINNTGACTLPAVSAAGTVSITSSGTVTALSGISGASVTVNATSGAINASALTASNGQISLTTASGAITADTLTALTNIAVDSGAALTFTNTAQSTNGSVDLKSKTALQTKKVTAIFSLKIANSVSGNVTIDGGAATNEALSVANGPMDVRSKALLTITGTTTSTLNEIQLESQGDLKADAISAGSHVRTESINGKVNVTATINSNTADVGGNMLITAKNNVRTGALKIVGQTTSGIVQIDSNKGGGSVLFTIGATNTNNGVNGSIDVSATSGGGTDLLFGRRGVFITNGTDNSNLGIRLATAASLKLLSTSSRSGVLWLNAQKGPLTIPGGIAIDANGASGQFAGQIFLLGQSMSFGNNATLRAVQGKTVTGNSHGVVLAAETINFQGTTNGLRLQADGSGKDVFNPAYAYILPQGTVTATSNNDFRNLNWTSPSIAAVETADKPVSLVGTGAAPLIMSANGSDTAIAIRGNGTNISTAGAITLTAKGKSNHTIRIRDTGPSGDAKGLSFGTSATPSITLDTSADNTVPGAGDAVGGEVRITSDVLSLNAVTYSLTSNGAATGNGNAGIIFFSTANSTIGATTKMTFSAVGPTSGTGNGGNITVFPGNVAGGTFKLGTNTGNTKVVADAGASGGDGGTINVNPFPGSISIETADAVSAKASSGASANSKGGSVTLIGNPNVTVVAASLTGAAINVDGKGNKDGGSISILGFGTINLGSSAGGLNLSAKASGTGNGGTIEIGYASILTQDGTLSVSATSGNGSNGKGGIINFHDLGKITIAGSVKADSAGTGKAGSITLAQTAFNPMTLDGATISASGGCESNGVCGIINITSPARISAVSTTIHADGTSGAKGGQVNLIGDSDQIVLDGALITASGSQSGADGGFININNNSASISVVDTKFNANGFVSGAGGQVRITSGPTQPLTANSSGFLVQAKGGDTGAGGIVVIPNLQQLGGANLFLVNTFIQAGSGVNVSNSSTFGGSVSLNGVTCQRTLFSSGYPIFYWNCVNPGNPSTLDGVPASAAQTWLPGNVKTQNATTNIYVMQDSAKFNLFFNGSVAADVAGYTLSEDNNNIVNVSVFENTVFPTTGYATLTSAQLTETTIHEFGHALDVLNGFASQTSVYATLINNDKAYLDAAGGGQPCLSNGTGPFNGVIDFQTGNQFCSNNGTGGTLNNPGGIYTGKTNSQIAAISQPGILTQNVEIYPQAFAYQDYVVTQSNQTLFPFTATANGLFKKNFYQCAQSLGASLAGKTYIPSYACN